MTIEDNRRSIAARMGICALNLLLPGLGLLRLARYRLGAALMLLEFALCLAVVGSYSLIGQMSFAVWAGIVTFALATAVIALLGSIVATWRASRRIEPRSGRAWRWYSVTGLALVWFAATWPLPDLARSRYHVFYVPSEAMLPTIQVDDRFLADMHAIDPIERGDIVIARVAGADHVKRVAGLPGDRIAMKDGIVVLNGTPVAKQFIGTTKIRDPRIDIDIVVVDATISRERFPGEAKPHLVMDIGRNPSGDFSEVVLPPGRYFLLGDNRDVSADSRVPPERFGLGLVARASITGRLAFRYWRRGEGFGPGGD